jgi:tetratricopeptide (TPR) repeat protein
MQTGIRNTDGAFDLARHPGSGMKEPGELAAFLAGVRKLRLAGALDEAWTVMSQRDGEGSRFPNFEFERAAIAQARGDLDGAAAIWERLGRRPVPRRELAWALLGSIRRQQERMAEAAEAFEEAFRTRTTRLDEWIYAGFADALIATGEHLRARAILIEGVQVWPEATRLRPAILSLLEKSTDTHAAAFLSALIAEGFKFPAAEALAMTQRLGPEQWELARLILLNSSVGPKSAFVAIIKLAEGHQDFELIAATIEAARAADLPLEAWYPVKYAEALVRLGAEPRRLEEAFRLTLAPNPNRRDLVQTWGRHAIAAVGPAAAADMLIDIQRSCEAPLPAVLAEIARQHGIAAPRRLFSRQVESLLASPPMEGLRRATTALWNAADPDPADVELARKATPPEMELFFLLGREPLRLFRYDQVGDALTAADLSGADVARTAGQLLGTVQTWWFAHIADSAFLTEAVKRHVLEKERTVSFQDRVLAERRLQVPDPFAPDRLIEPGDSFLIYDKVIYTFASAHMWHVITGGAAGDIQGILFPHINTAIYFQERPPIGLGLASLATMQTELMRRFLAAEAPVTKLKAAAADERPKLIVGCICGVENYAHQAWNSFSGLERQIIQGIHGNYAEIQYFGTEFFGSLEDIFPEIGSIPVGRHPNRKFFGGDLPSAPRLLLSIGGHLLSRPLIERLRQHAAQTAAPAIRSRLEGRTAVVIGLRANDKAWVDQEEGILSLVEKIAAEIPSCIFLLDGFSKPAGADYVSPKWSGTIAAIRKTAQRIIDRAPSAIEMVFLDDLSLNDCLALLDRIDLYVMPIGTLQHKFGWFGDAAGIVYASTSWQKFDQDLLPGIAEGELTVSPTYFYGRPNDGGQRKSLSDLRVNLDNVEIDVDALATTALGLLGKETKRCM